MESVKMQSINLAKDKNISFAKQTEPQKAESQKSKSGGTALLLGSLAAAGVIAAAVLSVRKGKQPTNVLKEIGVDKFKEAGNKFIKGKAVKADGTPFSGVITQIKKNGNKIEMNFSNGILTETKTQQKVVNGNFIPQSAKKYIYNNEDKLQNIENYSWGHVSHTDPKKSGFQYIKTSDVNLQEKRIKAINRFGADKCITRKSHSTADFSEKIYTKNGKEVARETISPFNLIPNKDDRYSEAYELFGWQKPNGRYKMHKTTEQLADGTTKITYKRVYETGEVDILKSGKFDDILSNPLMVEHVNANGKVTGYSTISQCGEASADYSFPHHYDDCLGRQYRTYDYYAPFKMEKFDANHKLESSVTKKFIVYER